MTRSAVDIAKDLLSRLPGFLDEHKEQLDAVVKHLLEFKYLDAQELAFVGSTNEVRDLINDAIKHICAHAGIEAGGIDMLVQLYRFIRRNARCAVCEHLEADPEFAMAKWSKKSLTYYLERAPKSIGMANFRIVMKDYFKNWSDVADLTFKEIDQSNSDILISTGTGPKDQFDGSGGTLAWAYLPNGQDMQLLMKFDDAESFSMSRTAGIYLESVATHELGHILGISHAPTAGHLMSPYYSRDVYKPQPWDVNEIQKRYGKPVNVAPPVTPPATPPAPPVTPPADNPYLVDANKIVIPGFRLVKV